MKKWIKEQEWQENEKKIDKQMSKWDWMNKWKELGNDRVNEWTRYQMNKRMNEGIDK